MTKLFKCLLIFGCLVGLAAGQVPTTCTGNNGKPCPEWLHKLIGQYPPDPEEKEAARNARLWTFGDGRARLKPDKLSWTIFLAGHAAAWGATIAAVRNPRSTEHGDEYGAMAGVTALDTIFFLTVNPAIGAAGPGYGIYHYIVAARR